MKLKYEKQKEIGTFLGEWYGIQLKDSNSFSNIDMILPVPLHNRKKRQRGYNQVSAFGKAIAAALGKPYSEDMLLKRKSTLSQTQKGRWLRWRDPDDIFTIENPELLHSKHVLLVDDIITTGGTIEACGSVLLDCPNTKLSILSMALSV
ncbi:MAG: phosphoribosyltransferase family protein [Flavobacteriaceae bacterium]|nr:phosphoribosyltransferase family protein [Flavobacteriaceae bacterium]